MNNKEIIEVFNKLDTEYFVCEEFTSLGYGQTIGGYRKHKDVMNQLKHFTRYYSNKGDKLPTYAYLRCPELLLFLAEAVGLNVGIVNEAAQIIKDYEMKNEIFSIAKNGNYMWGKAEFRTFKSTLHLGQIVKILKLASNWEEVNIEIEKINKMAEVV